MTREEALKILKETDRVGVNIIKANNEESCEYNAKSYEALDMAIKALWQEPCENAISREAAIDIVKHECGEWKGLSKEIVKQFNGLPPVQPKYNPDEWCHDCKEYDHDKHCCPRYNKVIRNTVEEMKQSCEDAVSRKWLVEALEAKGFSLTDTDYNIMIHLIRDTAPSVQPKIKVGHWIDIPKYKDIAWQCSECEYFTTLKHSYCPNCGAKMVEPQESEDKEC